VSGGSGGTKELLATGTQAIDLDSVDIENQGVCPPGSPFGGGGLVMTTSIGPTDSASGGSGIEPVGNRGSGRWPGTPKALSSAAGGNVTA
jgi:hypothetical protein